MKKWISECLTASELYKMMARDSEPEVRQEIGLTDENDNIIDRNGYWEVSWPKHCTPFKYRSDATYSMISRDEYLEVCEGHQEKSESKYY